MRQQPEPLEWAERRRWRWAAGGGGGGPSQQQGVAGSSLSSMVARREAPPASAPAHAQAPRLKGVWPADLVPAVDIALRNEMVAVEVDGTAHWTQVQGGGRGQGVPWHALPGLRGSSPPALAHTGSPC